MKKVIMSILKMPIGLIGLFIGLIAFLSSLMIMVIESFILKIFKKKEMKDKSFKW